MHLVREALDDPSAHLATENELQGDFPSIELGGAPVLGWLPDAETLVDPSVLERDTIVFAAGTRTESVRVRTLDLFRGEHAAFVPLVAERKRARMRMGNGCRPEPVGRGGPCGSRAMPARRGPETRVGGGDPWGIPSCTSRSSSGSTARRRVDYVAARSRIPSPVDQITTDS
jgi:hypothetical protein